MPHTHKYKPSEHNDSDQLLVCLFLKPTITNFRVELISVQEVRGSWQEVRGSWQEVGHDRKWVWSIQLTGSQEQSLFSLDDETHQTTAIIHRHVPAQLTHNQATAPFWGNISEQRCKKYWNWLKEEQVKWVSYWTEMHTYLCCGTAIGLKCTLTYVVVQLLDWNAHLLMLWYSYWTEMHSYLCCGIAIGLEGS